MSEADKLVKPSFDRIARNHITALRYYYPRLYNASTPKSSSVLILGILITLSTIVITGKILKSIYESDSPPLQTRTSQSSSSSKPSQWVSAEYEARKKDIDEKATLKRFKEEEKKIVKKFEERKKELDKEKYEKYMVSKCKERKKDLEMLKKMLKNKKLEPVGLDIVPAWYTDPDPPEEVKEVKEVKDVKTEVKVEKKAVDPTKITMGDKIRTALLGKNLATARKKEKASSSNSGGVVMMEPGTSVTPAIAAVPERGPGWEVASDPTTSVGLAKSAGNAEALARGMGK